MPPLRDPDIRAKILEALSASEKGEGVLWKRSALDELQRLLPRMRYQRINQIVRMHIQHGGEIDQCRETRPEWRNTTEYHYDFRITIDHRKRYIECLLIDDAPSHPELFVVSFHNA